MTADVEYSGRESFWPFARLVKTFCRHPMASELPIKRKDYVDETLKLQTWSSFHSPFRHVKKKRYSLVNQSKVLSRFDGSKEQANGELNTWKYDCKVKAEVNVNVDVDANTQ